MSYSVPILACVVTAAFFIFQRLAFVPPDTAREILAKGAMVIDVRSAEEFGSGHAPGAVNAELGRLRSELPRLVDDKNRVLLFYCMGGGRSALALRQARSLGYGNVFNLGSFSRAKRLIGEGRRG